MTRKVIKIIMIDKYLNLSVRFNTWFAYDIAYYYCAENNRVVADNSVHKVTRTYFVWRYAWNVRADTAQKLGGSKRENAWGPGSTAMRDNVSILDSRMILCISVNKVTRAYFVWRHALICTHKNIFIRATFQLVNFN